MSSETFVCEVCNLDYSTRAQFEEHFWSMIHHKELENKYGSGKTHLCSLCHCKSDSLSTYAKHLIGETHRAASEERKKQKQLQVARTSSAKSQSSNTRMVHANGHHRFQQYQHPAGSGNGPLPDPVRNTQNQWSSWTQQSSQFCVWGDNYVDDSNIHRSFQLSSAHQWNYGNGSNYVYSGNRTWMPMNKDHYAQNNYACGGYNNPYALSNMTDNSSGVSSGTRQAQTTDRSHYLVNAKTLPTQKSSVSKGGCRAVAAKSVTGLKDKSTSNRSLNPSSGVKDKTQLITKPVKNTGSCGDQRASDKAPLSSKSDSVSKGLTSISKPTQAAVGSRDHEPASQAPLNDKSYSLSTAEPASSKPNQAAHTSGIHTATSTSLTCGPDAPPNRKKKSRWDNPVSATRCLSLGSDPTPDGTSDEVKGSTSQDKDKNSQKTPSVRIASKSTEAGKAPEQFATRKSRACSNSQSKVKPLQSGQVSKPLKVPNTAAVKAATEKPSTASTISSKRILSSSAVNGLSRTVKYLPSASSTSQQENAPSSEPTSKMLQRSESVPNTSAMLKSPPEVTRVRLPRANSDPGNKVAAGDSVPVSDGANSARTKPVSCPPDGTDEEASVTRVQLPPSLQRELTKLLLKSQGPRPRPNLAAARSRLHAGEHHQAQVVESPDRMVQQLLMKLLDSPKSRDRQVQQIEELQQLVQASRKGSERARFSVQQFPEVSMSVLESLLQSGHLKPLLSEDASATLTAFAEEYPLVLAGHERVKSSNAGKTVNPINTARQDCENPTSSLTQKTELVDSKEAVRALINVTTVNQVHPLSSSGLGQEDTDSKESLKSLLAATDLPASLPTHRSLHRQKKKAAPEVVKKPQTVKHEAVANPPNDRPNDAEDLSAPTVSVTVKTEPGVDAVEMSHDEAPIEEMPPPTVLAASLCNMPQSQTVAHLSVCNPHEPSQGQEPSALNAAPTNEEDGPSQDVALTATALSAISDPVIRPDAPISSVERAPTLLTEKATEQQKPSEQENPAGRGDPPGSLKEVLLDLSLQEELLHKKLDTEEASMKATKEFIQKKQVHFKKLKEQKKKISKEVLAIRTKRLQLLTDATQKTRSASVVSSPAINPVHQTMEVPDKASRPRTLSSSTGPTRTAKRQSCVASGFQNSGTGPRKRPNTAKSTKCTSNNQLLLASGSVNCVAVNKDMERDQPGTPVSSHESAPAQPMETRPSRKSPAQQVGDSPAGLQEVLLELSLQEELLHKKLATLERIMKATKKLIQKKQQHFRKHKEQKNKVSMEVLGIRTRRLHLLTEATRKSCSASAVSCSAINPTQQTMHAPDEVSTPCTSTSSNASPPQGTVTLPSCQGDATSGASFSDSLAVGQVGIPPECESGTTLTAQNKSCLDCSSSISCSMPRLLPDMGKTTKRPAHDQLVVEMESMEDVAAKNEMEDTQERGHPGDKRRWEQDKTTPTIKQAKMDQSVQKDLTETEPVEEVPVTGTLTASNESAQGSVVGWCKASSPPPSEDTNVDSDFAVSPFAVTHGPPPCKEWMQQTSTYSKWVKEVKLYRIDTRQGSETTVIKTKKLADDEQVLEPSVEADIDINLENSSGIGRPREVDGSAVKMQTENATVCYSYDIFEISSDSETCNPVHESHSETSQMNQSHSSTMLAKKQKQPCLPHGLFPNHNGAVLGMCIENEVLYTVAADCTARIFNINDFSCIKVLTGHMKEVNCLTLWNHSNLASERYLCTGSNDCSVRVYNKQTWDHEMTFACESRVTCLVVRGHNVYAAMEHGGVDVFSMKSWQKIKTLPCKMDCKIEVMISLRWPLCYEWNKSMWLVVGYEDWTIGVHTMAEGRLLKSLLGHDGTILCMKAHGNLLYSGSSDKSVMVHDLERGKRITTIFGHANSVTGLELLPDHIITSCIDGKIRQFNRKSGSFQRVIASFPQMILCMAGCRKTLYIGCVDGTVQAVSVNPPPEPEKLRKLPNSAKKKRNTQKDKQAACRKAESHGCSLRSEARKQRQQAKRLKKQKAAEKKVCGGCNAKPVKAVSVDPQPKPKKSKKVTQYAEVKRYCRWTGCRCIFLTRRKMTGHLKRTHLKKSNQCLWGECRLQFTREMKQEKGEHADDHMLEFYEGSAVAKAKKRRREEKRLKKLKAEKKKASTT